MKKAIAYTADITFGTTGEVISRSHQKELIRKYAAENGIDVVAWFEDARADEELLKRPGIQAMLAYNGPAEVFLLERVWALSRNVPTLQDFFTMLAPKNMRFEAASYLWDCISQIVRRQIAVQNRIASPQFKRVAVSAAARKAAIAKPERFHFAGLTSEGVAASNDHEQAA